MIRARKSSLLAMSIALILPLVGGWLLAVEEDDLVTDADGVRRRGEIEVEICTSQKRYVAGEKMLVSVIVHEDCYLRLLYVSAAGELIEIYPNAFRRKNRIVAGNEVRVPSEADEFDFVMRKPFGKEHLKAIVCSHPFELGDAEKAKVGALIWSSARPAVTKGIIVAKRQGKALRPADVPKFRFGEATVTYEVYAKP